MLILKVKGLDKTMKLFKNFHNENPKAIKFAMNGAAGVAQTASLKKTRQAWNIKARDLKRYVKAKKATVNDATYVFEFHSTPINLQEFEGVDEFPNGVRYKIKKKRAWMPKGFIKGSGRNRFVLKRTTDARYPLRPHFSVTPSYMFQQEKGVQEYIKVFYKGKDGTSGGFKYRYLHQLNRLLKK